ncbi:hypothetical protein [Pseudoprimorskyibacter insulae]|nr:hypothetical protein [Pseudoprimorskyibacter insulae]
MAILVPVGVLAGAYLGYTEGTLVSIAIGAVAGAFLGTVSAHIINFVTNLAFSLAGMIIPVLVVLGIVYFAYQRAM